MSSTRKQGAAGQSDIARRRTQRRLASGRKSDARWQEVLEGAGRVFQRVGYPQATLEDVANEVGINRATLYYYVGTKEELLVSLLYRPIEQMRVDLEEIVAKEMPPGQKLATALRTYLVALSERPELFIFLGENIDKVMTVHEAEEIQRNADRYGRLLTSVIADGAASGEFRADLDPQVATMGIIGMVNWMYRWYEESGSKSLVELGETFVEMALASLSPEAANRVGAAADPS
ncbi:TetR/AcrR family transcriptional regulator [Salinactinospora qingdaonensis]|uniref:TetR/AcrR family transcriptional regulator n=1 Tax=Salinactinospora qingdaonensis TaxID=702744 RepID=UPI0031EF84A5